MPVRSDVTIDWQSSPRVLTVAAPSTSITVQDLVDTCRFLEEQIDAVQFTHLVNAAGKESLGGGRFVGITATLQNAKVKFADRAGPSVVACVISGGNLVGVDASNAEIDPVADSTFTRVTRELSTSAALVTSSAALTNDDLNNIADRVWDEMRADHVLTGSFGAAVPSGVPSGQALANFPITMRLETGAFAPGVAVTAQLSKDGGAFALATNAVIEVGFGVYRISLTATELTCKTLFLRFTAPGCDPTMVTVVTS